MMMTSGERNYRQQWWPATYVGDGPRRGRTGEARHVQGDTWQFKYVDGDEHTPIVLYVNVFRTEVDLYVKGG